LLASRLIHSASAPCHRSSPKPNRRALELLASCRDGCTEAIMLAHGFSIDTMVELVNAGVVSVTTEHVAAGSTGSRSPGSGSQKRGGGRSVR
jgi:hypothetical protein